ncbi:MAG: hypothetical protein GY898_13265 [Proteobacteria bacterium]|nr:hypothetical protein [Pseudomonadota bacterium]
MAASSTAMAQGRNVVIVGALVIALLVPVLLSAHRHTDAWSPRHRVVDEVKYLPTGRALKATSLGYEQFVADMLWIRTTLLFGKRYASQDHDWYSWVFHMIDLATDLDPEFKAAYKYGGTMLRSEGVFIDQSSLIFGKGMVHRPDLWELPFGIGMNYFMFKDDRETAARYIAMAAKTGKGPFYLRNLAASLQSDSGDLDSALIFLQTDLESIPESQKKAREAVEVKIIELKYLIARRDAMDVVTEFRRLTGDLPENPADVASRGLELPRDPFLGQWTWDPDPKMEVGTLISTNYCEVFTQLAREHGLGRLTFASCQAELVDSP